MRVWVSSGFAILNAAIQFLTVLPVRRHDGAQPRMVNTLAVFPLVGLLIGALLALSNWFLSRVFAPGIVNALLLVIGAGVTGFLHLDGFADSCDGLLCHKPPEKRLEIMRESCLGAFGVVGIVLLLLTRYAALEALPIAVRSPVLLLAPVLGRWAMAYATVAYPYARLQGLGTPFQATGGWQRVIIATVLTLLIAFASLHVRGLLLLGCAWITVLFAAAFTMQRIRGLTGDSYGAINELSEVMVLLVAAALPLALPAAPWW